MGSSALALCCVHRCRRLVSALYQVKVELNKADDKEGRPRQPFPEFVPDQFIVLFGLKSLAIKSM